MGIKNTVISLLVIMAFFSTFLMVTQKAETGGYLSVVNSNVSNKITSEQVVARDSSARKLLIEDKHQKTEDSMKEQFRLDELEKEIRGYLGDNINKVGLIYYDINSKKSVEINADKQFIAASTVKIPINMLMYDMIQEKKIDINEKIEFQEEDFEEGAGELQDENLGKPIPIKTLIEYSIKYSDNIAINMILRRVGSENKYNFIETIVGHPIAHEGNNITPRDSFKILERLYLNPNNNEYYPKLIETMRKTVFHDRIDKYIPSEMVAHKIGDYEGYVNDIGIVFKENPYILVVFTKEVPDANETIGQISKMIYDSQK